MKKKSLIAAAILIILAIAVTVAVVFNKNQNRKSGDNNNSNTWSAPELNIYYDNENIGSIDGYLMEMEAGYIRDTIIPISANGQTQMEIKSDKDEVLAIKYQVRSAGSDTLVDASEIEDWTTKDDTVKFTYEASAIMNSGAEYYLQFIISTKEHGDVYYYTRAMASDEEFVKDQIKFAKDFSEKTFDLNKASELALYLEPDLKAANDNLGKIDIKSSYSMLTWNTLKPKRLTSAQIVAKDFCIKDSGQAGTYSLYYQIQATNAQKVVEKYNVEETITVWSFQDKQYVLAYNREVNQIWENNKYNVGNAFIDLGIQNASSIEFVESNNQQYLAFAINGDVYVMDVLKKQIRPIFKLDAEDSDRLNKTKAEVLKVDDKGNVDYMIYGYSPTQTSQAKNGISILRYRAEEIKSTEVAFIPCKVPVSILDNQLSNLCYVGDGTLYIMLENTVYYANLETKEWGVVIANIEDGSFAINDNGDTIAYNTNGTHYDSDSITVIDLTNGKKRTVTAAEGEKITVCGYTGVNLVYGMAKESKIGKYNFFPMYKMEIADKELKTIKSYSKSKVFITDIEITDTIINIKRVKNGRKIEDDHLLDNTEDQSALATSSYYQDDIKQKELAIAFTNNLDASTELIMSGPAAIDYRNDVEVAAWFEKEDADKYYVYGYGKLQGIYAGKEQAIKAAKETYGLVTNKAGEKIWVFEENYE